MNERKEIDYNRYWELPCTNVEFSKYKLLIEGLGYKFGSPEAISMDGWSHLHFGGGKVWRSYGKYCNSIAVESICDMLDKVMVGSKVEVTIDGRTGHISRESAEELKKLLA